MVVKRLSFTEYLASKEKLLEAVKRVPVVEHTYSMKKYCKFPSGQNQEKELIPLKPSDIVSIKWKYTDPENGTRIAESITINDRVIESFWKNEKIEKWVSHNCIELA